MKILINVFMNALIMYYDIEKWSSYFILPLINALHTETLKSLVSNFLTPELTHELYVPLDDWLH